MTLQEIDDSLREQWDALWELSAPTCPYRVTVLSTGRILLTREGQALEASLRRKIRNLQARRRLAVKNGA